MRKHSRPTADEIRELRLLKGMTQRNLADLLCVSIKTVQAYEQGKRIMPASTWLLMLLCVPLTPSNDGYLFVGDGIEENQSP